MEKIIVVGSGFSGGILARKIAEELDQRVLVVEKRPHIGGNMYDEVDEHGILIQRYGPHFLNTNKYSIIRFLSQYAELFPFATELLSFIDGRYVRLPFNFETVQQLIGPEQAEGPPVRRPSGCQKIPPEIRYFFGKFSWQSVEKYDRLDL